MGRAGFAALPVARVLIALALVPAFPAYGRAQARPQDLARVSIEDLMKIEITSAAKKEQRAEDVPAAVFVITQDDIRRSGLRSLPELFRLVPGMQVAQVNSNKWAISARGFNDLFSNKLLVLIDGRSLYTHAFGGVFWDGEDLMLQDIDRIEVIRGAGGTVWGANAMNGVINIVTKSAADTRGTSVDGERGDLRARSGIRSPWRVGRRGGVSSVLAVVRSRRFARPHREAGPTTAGTRSRPVSVPTGAAAAMP